MNKPVKIVFDIRHIDKGGIGVYIYKLLANFTEYVDSDDIELTVISCENQLNRYRDLKTARLNIVKGPKLFSLKEQLWFLSFTRKHEFDVYFSPYITFPIFTRKPIVLTLHDTIWLNFPEHASSGIARIYFLVMLRLAAWKCRKIVCISHNTAQDLSNWTNADKQKIVVVYNGSNVEHLKNKNVDERPYIIYVGSWKPWKRVPDLISAFEELTEQLAPENIPELLIAGEHNYNRSDDIKALVDRSNAREHIKILGRQNQESLNDLIAKAIALVHPSEYEGFGMTIVEAMSLGTPVIAVNTGSIPEVLGDAGIMVSPRDVNALKSAMQKLLDNEKLRQQIAKKGYEQAAKFNWKKTALLTLETLKAVAK